MGRAPFLLALALLCFAVHGQQQAQETSAVPAVATLAAEPSVQGTTAAAATDQLTGQLNTAALLVASSSGSFAEQVERPDEKAQPVENYDTLTDNFPRPHHGPQGQRPHPHHKGEHHKHHRHHHRKNGKGKKQQPPFPCHSGDRMPGPPPCRPPFPCQPPAGDEEPRCGPPFPHHHHHHHHDREEQHKHHKWSKEDRSWWQSMAHSIDEFADDFEFDLDDFDDDGWQLFLGVACLGLGAAAVAAWITYRRRVQLARQSIARSLPKLGNGEEQDPLLKKEQHSSKAALPCSPPSSPPPPGPPSL